MTSRLPVLTLALALAAAFLASACSQGSKAPMHANASPPIFWMYTHKRVEPHMFPILHISIANNPAFRRSYHISISF